MRISYYCYYVRNNLSVSQSRVDFIRSFLSVGGLCFILVLTTHLKGCPYFCVPRSVARILFSRGTLLYYALTTPCWCMWLWVVKCTSWRPVIGACGWLSCVNKGLHDEWMTLSYNEWVTELRRRSWLDWIELRLKWDLLGMNKWVP